jgi:hypothetical protein
MISNDRETATNHTNYQSAIWIDHHITGCSYGYTTSKRRILNVDLNFNISITMYEFSTHMCWRFHGTVFIPSKIWTNHYNWYQIIYQLVFLYLYEMMYFYSSSTVDSKFDISWHMLFSLCLQVCQKYRSGIISQRPANILVASEGQSGVCENFRLFITS